MKQHLKDVLDQIEGWSYDDIDQLVYELQGIQIEMMGGEKSFPEIDYKFENPLKQLQKLTWVTTN